MREEIKTFAIGGGLFLLAVAALAALLVLAGYQP
jgi:hypothetical protein